MKTCFKCGKEKEISEFPKHNQMADGHLNKCIECNRKDASDYREKNIEKIRKYDRQRSKLPHRRKLNRIHSKLRRKRKPLQCVAAMLLNYAVRAKRVKKKIRCEKCGRKGKLHGHHEDYYKPLEVTWLCCICHHARHKESKDGNFSSSI